MNMDSVEGAQGGEYREGNRAQGEKGEGRRKKLKVLESDLTLKLQVDVEWDVQPAAAASSGMWIGLYRKGASLAEPQGSIKIGDDKNVRSSGKQTITLNRNKHVSCERRSGKRAEGR